MKKIKLGNLNTKEFVEMFGTDKLKIRYKKDKSITGRDKELLLKKASKYCDIQDLSQGKYNITKIYTADKEDLILPLKKGLNKFLTPLILNKLIELDCDNNFKFTLSLLKWAKQFEIINENYGFIKFNQDKCFTHLNVEPDTMLEYFNKIDSCIKYYFEKNLAILSDKSGLDLIDYESFQKVRKLFTNNDKNAEGGYDIGGKYIDEIISDDDRKFYYECERIAKERAGITRVQEKFYGKKSYIYKRELKVLLSERHILFMYPVYNIYCKDANEVRKTLAKFNDVDTSPEEFVRVFNEKFVEYIEKKATSRHNKEIELSLDVENIKIIKPHRLLESYINDYRNLSEITINRDSENVEKKYDIKTDTVEDNMKKLNSSCTIN